MDTLVLQLERLIFGANLDFEATKIANGDLLSTSLAALYDAYKQRVGAVKVRALAPDNVEINFPQGALRILALQDGTWRLANVATDGGGKTPGEIAVILANP